jgi:CheY-like chemotaxis protein
LTPVLVILIVALALGAVVRRVAARPRPAEAPPPAVATAHSVLVVDDEPTVRLSTSRLLERAGFEVLQASSAAEALPILKSRRLSLVLSDVVMPGANGFELAAAVGTISPGTAILLFSAFTPMAIQRHNLRGESDARLLQKPFERSELIEAVNDAIAAAQR